jgi:hypothetical protein
MSTFDHVTRYQPVGAVAVSARPLPADERDREVAGGVTT